MEPQIIDAGNELATEPVPHFDNKKLKQNVRSMKFFEYFNWYNETYKKGKVRPVTYKKYVMNAHNVEKLAPEMLLIDLENDRRTLQWLLDQFGATHRHQTTMDFKIMVYAALRSAVDDGFIAGISSSKIVITSVESTWTPEQRRNLTDKVKVLTSNEFRALRTRLDIDLTNYLSRPPAADTREFKKGNQGKIGSFPIQTYLQLIAVIAHTGCRFAEALGLTINDIGDDYIDINKTFDYKISKKLAPTKNEGSVRKVFVDDTIIYEIRKYFEWRKRYYFDWDPSSPLFVIDKDFSYNGSFNNFFKILERSYGFKEDISIHKIRHTYISYLLNEGISAELIAKQVGHKGTNMISRIYGHLMDERAEIDKVKIRSLMS